MGKRGKKPQGKVNIKWSPEFAYAIGLITTDGNLSSNNRTISLASSDIEQIENLKKCLNVENKIGRHNSGTSKTQGFRIQFGDILFYKFLQNIGLSAHKSLTIGSLLIPRKYYFDFLRGHFDGDGTFYSYWDKRWRSSYMFYLYFYSASKRHIDWLRSKNEEYLGISGHITKPAKDSTHSLRYAKKESLILLRNMYRNKEPKLSRKYLKIQKALAILGKSF